MLLKCETVTEAKDKGGHQKKGVHRRKHGKSMTPFAKAARKCTGKTGGAFWKCVNKHLK